MGDLFKGASRKVLEAAKRGEKEAPRRTTAPAPNGSKSVDGPRLRPQSQATPSDVATAPKIAQLPKKKIILGVGGAVLVASVAAMAMHHGSASAPPGAQATNAPAVVTAAPPSTGAPLSAAPIAADPNAPGATTANVPLFGPTPMATMEPAPLAPPPGSPEAVEAQEKADAKTNATGAPVVAAAADEGFSDESSDGDAEKADAKASKSDEKSAKTDTTPWGHGKLHSPTIYRLRLDGPGGKIEGALLPTGFTVLVPGHKLMEQGAGISKRDNRIANVRTLNRTQGAEIDFHFRDSVPAYRVRLRQQSQASLADEETVSPLSRLPKKKMLLGVGGAALLASVVTMAMHHGSAPPGAQAALAPAMASVAPRSVGAPLSALPTPGDNMTSGVASANVPLFGPTPMA
ncbi:MAG TPA: hypothetical protein VGH63_18765, partial [Polyangia bacterium]